MPPASLSYAAALPLHLARPRLVPKANPMAASGVWPSVRSSKLSWSCGGIIGDENKDPYATHATLRARSSSTDPELGSHLHSPPRKERGPPANTGTFKRQRPLQDITSLFQHMVRPLRSACCSALWRASVRASDGRDRGDCSRTPWGQRPQMSKPNVNLCRQDGAISTEGVTAGARVGSSKRLSLRRQVRKTRL